MIYDYQAFKYHLEKLEECLPTRDKWKMRPIMDYARMKEDGWKENERRLYEQIGELREQNKKLRQQLGISTDVPEKRFCEHGSMNPMGRLD